jgi:hypothetical protein
MPWMKSEPASVLLSYKAKKTTSRLMTRVDALANSNKPREQYKITNWSEYNTGLKRRGSLTLWIDESVSSSWYHQGPIKRGGQMIYSAACILVLLTLKATFRLLFRQLEGFAESILS